MGRRATPDLASSIAITRTAQRLLAAKQARASERMSLVASALLDHRGVRSIVMQSRGASLQAGSGRGNAAAEHEYPRLSIRCRVSGASDAPLEMLAALACAVLAAGDALPEKPEEQVLDHLRRGLRNKEIAVALGCSEVTVERHLTRLYRRFQVRGRQELLLRAPWPR